MKTLKLSVLAMTALTIGLISCKKENALKPIPTISSFTPTAAFSGDTVTITGTNFIDVSGVSFGNSDAASFIVSNATTIKAVVGTGASGDVKVVTTEGSASLPGFTLKVSAPAITVTDSIEVPFSSNNYIFYRFKDSAVVSQSDSASTKWDFGIRFVSIIANSHASGPGEGAVITQHGIYDDYTAAPESGYAYDTTTTKLAIDDGLTTGWYGYNPATHAFTPKAGQFFVFKTADGHYAKLEITAVDYAGYTPPNPTPTTLVYRIRYSYQADGSRNF